MLAMGEAEAGPSISTALLGAPDQVTDHDQDDAHG
jgi:hypothetical protein